MLDIVSQIKLAKIQDTRAELKESREDGPALQAELRAHGTP